MGICSNALFNLLLSDLGSCQHAYGLELARKGSSVSNEWYQPGQIAVMQLAKSFLKKFKDDQLAAADQAAYDLFLHWNQRCKDWKAPEPRSDFMKEILGSVQTRFMKCFERPDGNLIDFSDEVACFLRPGPGAAVNAAGGDLYSKIAAGPLSTTSLSLYSHYIENACRPFELEMDTECTRSSHFRTPLVEGSKLGFAPKNREISRTRCTEPSLNMLYQLATGQIVEDEILDGVFKIRLDVQPLLNRELARRGSLSGKFCTIDLSSASDAIALGLWHWLMPYREIRNWFAGIRSRNTTYSPVKGKDVGIELHLLSSMGNGFTFPIMTTIFACVVEAVYDALGIPFVRNREKPRMRPALDGLYASQEADRFVPGNFGVMGDDIIVVREAYGTVCSVLELLGFDVNRGKSFGDGAFRESCGGDFYHGHNVRGVYCKSLRTPHSRYALINRLNAWSSNWDIPLTRTISALTKSVRFTPVPPYEGATAGIIVPLTLVGSSVRVCKDKGSTELPRNWHSRQRVDRKHREVQSVSGGRYANTPGSLIYARYLATPYSWSPCDGHPRRKSFVNASGVILSAVRGYLRNGLITVREDNVKYQKRLAVCPGWAYDGTSQVGFTPEGWARFEKYLARVNLG